MAARPVSRLSSEQQRDCLRGLALSMILRGATFLSTQQSLQYGSTASAGGGSADDEAPLFDVLWNPLYCFPLLLAKVLLWTLAYDFFYYALHRFLHWQTTLFRQVRGGGRGGGTEIPPLPALVHWQTTPVRQVSCPGGT